MKRHEIGYMDIMYELTAMSVICRKEKGYGFVLSIYSRDHNPPHIHVAKNLNSMDIAKIAISMETPKDKKDIIILDGKLTSKQKESLVKWANMPMVNGGNVSNWDYAKVVWTQNCEGKPLFLPLRIKIIKD